MANIKQLELYLGMGWPLFPCSAENKKPLTIHGFKDASTDRSVITIWLERYPDCAWGTPTTAERGVVDIDPRHGGDVCWAKLIAEHGELPPHPITETGSGGWHNWLTFLPGTKCSQSVIGKGIDVKAEGGYVIVPPSRIHEAHHFQPYRWAVKPWDVPEPLAPAWLSALANTPKSKAIVTSPSAASAPTASASGWVVEVDDLRTHQGSPQGQRRVTLLRLVGSALASGMAPEAVYMLAEEWAGRCQPSFGEWEKHVAGLLRKESAKGVSREPHNLLLHSPFSASGSGGKEGTNSPILMPEAETPNANQSVPHFQVPNSEPYDADKPEANKLVPSFPEPELRTGKGEGIGSCTATTPSALTLQPDARIGLFGEMLAAIEPETEAAPAGVLLSWLALYGNAIGRGSWVQVGSRRHHPALYVGIEGRTSDAKGDNYGTAVYPFRFADPEWASRCIANGIGSGEGFIERIADEVITTDAKGQPVVIPGAIDKRLLLRLSELSRCFKVGRRDGSTLSEMLRETWDGEAVNIPNRKANALSSSGYTVSVIGDITPAVLQKLLASGMEAFDGFANRFLWCHVTSPRSLPDGGNITVLDAFTDRLRNTITFGKQAGAITRDAEAEALWREVYPSLKASGDNVPHTDRARPYVVRLSMLYALADRQKVIGVRHLKAALALWEYCRLSAATLFGTNIANANPEPDPLWLRLLNIIQSQPGIARGELLRAIREPAEAVGEALSALSIKGMAHSRLAQNPNGGPKAERWYPGCREPEPETDKPEGDRSEHEADIDKPHNLHLPFPGSVYSHRKEGTNSDAVPGSDADQELVPSDADRGTNSGEADGGVSSFLPGSEAAEGPTPDAGNRPGEREKEVVTPTPTTPRARAIHQWADKGNTTGITREIMTTGNRDMIFTKIDLGNAILGEAEYLPTPKQKPEPGPEGVNTEYVCRHSDLRWECGTVVGIDLNPTEVEWMEANPRKAEAIARRKCLHRQRRGVEQHG